MKRVFADLFGLSALMVSMSVAGQATDGEAKPFHNLPMLVNGNGFQSTLLVTNVADRANRCNLELLPDGLSASSFETHESLTWNGSGATIDLSESGTRISISGRNLSPPEVYGSATLDCDLPVVARVLVTLSSVSLSQENAVAAALLPSAQTGAVFKFPVLPKMGGYLLAVHNGQGGGANCRVELADESGVVADEQPFSVAGNASIFRELSELGQAPTDFGGGSATVSCDRQVAATGLLVGAAFSGLPPAVLSNVPTPTVFAPVNSSAFDRFVVGKRFVNVDDSRYYTEFPSVGEFVEVKPGERYTGTYSYSNTGPNTGILTLNYSDGDTCTSQIALTSATTGSSRFTCRGGETGGGNWRLDDSQSSTGDDAGVVTIPDANLKAAIEAALGKVSNTPITQADMRMLTTLGADSSGIRNLAGLETAVNLNTLRLGDNNIADISPLAGLTELTELSLQSNEISNISALSALTGLQFLKLGYNNGSLLGDEDSTGGIEDISPLSNLTNLHSLELQYNKIEDISPLNGLVNLRYLSLDLNNFVELSELSGLTNLNHLFLQGLGIADVSALSSLNNLQELMLNSNDISDISPLASLTNLIYLGLWYNDIEDISPLAGLTNLRYLTLRNNDIEDISPLAGLTDLIRLDLWNNGIESISAISNLPRLTELNLGLNNVADISGLEGLTNLTTLDLNQNDITDISALAGLNMLEILDLRGNLLNDSSSSAHIATLEGFGATIRYNALVKGDYDIELIFTDDFSERQQRVLTYVARRWMAVIAEDAPDYEFAQGWSGHCGDASYEIPAGERIDDLRIYMSTHDDDRATGYGGPRVLRQNSYLPVLGCMSFNLDIANLMITGLHEIGHVLGFGTVWSQLDLIQELDGDTHFSGPLAIAAFDEAGGANFSGAKVPVEKMSGSHWRVPELGGELMGPYGGGFLSAISVQSLADLGYGVDVAQADDFSLPTSISTEAVRSMDSRISAPLIELGPSHNEIQHFSGDLNPGQNPIHVVDRQGRILRVIESHVAGHP